MATTGTGEPTRASLALHVAANGSAATGQEAAVALIGDGTELALRETAETVEGVGIPPVRDLFEKL